MNEKLKVQIEDVLFGFRRAFLKYLIDPNDINQNKLHEVANTLSKLAFLKINKSFETHGISEELNKLIQKALKNINVCTKKIQMIEHSFNDDKSNENALFVAQSILKERLVTDAQDEVFASIYAIELDGYRLRNIDPEASAACLALSANLLELSQKTTNKTR